MAAGCGKKGLPLAPLVTIPAPVGNLVVRRLASDVYVEFRVPTQNADAGRPTSVDVAQVEVYAMTVSPAPAAPRPELNDFVRRGTLVARIDVDPDLLDGEGVAETPRSESSPKPTNPRPGDVVTVVERLTPQTYVPVEFQRRARRPVPPVAVASRAPALSTGVEPPLSRTYLIVGVNRSGRRGRPSPAVRVPLIDPPRPPSAPLVKYGEKVVTVEWQPPPGARRSVQADAPRAAAPRSAPVLQSQPIVEWPSGWRYEVYEVGPATARLPTPLNRTPQEETRYQDQRVAFGTQRCYVVRTIESVQGATVLSAPSPQTCVTFQDTFPPAPPRGLAVVATAGAISLIWEANSEPDIAGYLVLRGGAADETLQPLTARPVPETRYRDSEVQPGVRYVYAVQAVDTARPPNVSPPSERVQEDAR